MKIIICGCLIAQMKRMDALVATQKTPTLKTLLLLKKSVIFEEKNLIICFSMDFFSNGTLQRVEVFCVIISASRLFI